jgi:hypothetical protein
VYTSAWNAATQVEKRAALEASVSDRGVYRDPLTLAEGHDALVATMLAFHERVPGGHFETTSFLAHNGRSVACWTMLGAGRARLGDGISYGEYDAAGRLVAMTGFFES